MKRNAMMAVMLALMVTVIGSLATPTQAAGTLEDVTFTDGWHVTGLKGTGSFDYTIPDSQQRTATATVTVNGDTEDERRVRSDVEPLLAVRDAFGARDGSNRRAVSGADATAPADCRVNPGHPVITLTPDRVWLKLKATGISPSRSYPIRPKNKILLENSTKKR